MPDYAAMYHRLFRSQTQAIELLQKAQQDTEEMYISSPDTVLSLIPKKEQPDESPGDKGGDKDS